MLYAVIRHISAVNIIFEQNTADALYSGIFQLAEHISGLFRVALD